MRGFLAAVFPRLLTCAVVSSWIPHYTYSPTQFILVLYRPFHESKNDGHEESRAMMHYTDRSLFLCVDILPQVSVLRASLGLSHCVITSESQRTREFLN